MGKKTASRNKASSADNDGRTFQRNTITIDFAEQLVRKTVEECEKLGRQTVIAVCDESGMLKTFRRADGAPLRSIGLAVTKAKSAAGFESTTHGFYNSIKDDEQARMGACALHDFTFLSGGFPIVIDGSVVGGIGVSGAMSSQEDVDFLLAAFEKLGLDTEIGVYR